MIHDKDYMMRMVMQFSDFLSKLLLGKNEGLPDDEQLVFETQMKDIFKMNFEELSAKTSDELIGWVDSHESHHHAAYYELLGHLFYFKFKEAGSRDFAEKSKTFYEIWIQRSQIFSLPVIQRINEIKA